MKYLYPFECEKKRLSTPAELQAAIDGNRREGRRQSYGPYPDMVRDATFFQSTTCVNLQTFWQQTITG